MTCQFFVVLLHHFVCETSILFLAEHSVSQLIDMEKCHTKVVNDIYCDVGLVVH